MNLLINLIFVVFCTKSFKIHFSEFVSFKSQIRQPRTNDDGHERKPGVLMSCVKRSLIKIPQ